MVRECAAPRGDFARSNFVGGGTAILVTSRPKFLKSPPKTCLTLL